MGYGVEPYAVDVGALAELYGCKDQELLERLQDEASEDLDALDETFGEEAEGVSAREALRQILWGEATREELGFLYAYALKVLVEDAGEMLPNQHMSAMPRMEYLETVEEAASNVEAGFSIMQLLFGGPPLPLPPPDDFPGVGHATRDEVKTVAAGLDQVDLSGLDPEVRASLTEIMGWYRHAARHDLGLVLFFH